MENQFKEIFSDSEFAKRALALSPEELQKVLKEEKGVDVSLDEIKDAGIAVNSFLAKGEEFSAEELEMVAGGGKKGDFAAGVISGLLVVGGALVVGMSMAVIPW